MEDVVWLVHFEVEDVLVLLLFGDKLLMFFSGFHMGISFVLELIIGLFEVEADESEMISDFFDLVFEVFVLVEFPFQLYLKHFYFLVFSLCFLFGEQQTGLECFEVFEFVGHFQTRLPDFLFGVADLLYFPFFIFL